jgi:hypothetical protein
MEMANIPMEVSAKVNLQATMTLHRERLLQWLQWQRLPLQPHRHRPQPPKPREQWLQTSSQKQSQLEKITSQLFDYQQ